MKKKKCTQIILEQKTSMSKANMNSKRLVYLNTMRTMIAFRKKEKICVTFFVDQV